MENVKGCVASGYLSFWPWCLNAKLIQDFFDETSTEQNFGTYNTTFETRIFYFSNQMSTQ